MKTAKLILPAAILTLVASSALADAVGPIDVMIKDNAVAASLTGAPGDPDAGRKSFADRKLGNCLACHANTDLKNELFHGNVGPELDGVAERYGAEELRAIIINSKAVFGDETVMPGFYSLDVGKDVNPDLEGKTILSAEQVEDIVAYLGTLKAE
jgi:sulfur-oxidizing protein SoxX